MKKKDAQLLEFIFGILYFLFAIGMWLFVIYITF